MFLLTALLLATVPPLGVWAVAVRGPTRCPSASDVSDRIGALVSPQMSLPSTDWLELRDIPAQRPGPEDLEIQLVRAGVDQPVGVRRIRRGSSCAETADAAAVVAASWVGEYPSFPVALPALPESASPVEDLPSAPPGPPPVAAAPAMLAVARASALPGGGAHVAHRFGLGASAGVVTTPGAEGSTGFLQIDGELLLRNGWLLRLAGAATGQREQPLGEGRIAWRRVLLVPSIGWAWRGFGWRSIPLLADIGAGPAAALIDAQGKGFSPNGRDTSLDVGFAPAIRFGIGWGRLPVAAWVGGTAPFWFRRHQIEVEGPPPGDGSAPQPLLRSLPRWDLSVMGGLTFLLPG